MASKLELKIEKQHSEYAKVNDSKPFTRRANSFIELYMRYFEIQYMFITKDDMNKKERETLLYELLVLKGSMNSILPDYNYPNKKG